MLMSKKKAMAKIDELAALDAKIKPMAADLKAGKEELVDWYVDVDSEAREKKITTPKGSTATFVSADVFDPIDVAALQKVLKAQGKGDKELFACLSVNMTALKKQLGAADIEKLRGESIATKISVRLKS